MEKVRRYIKLVKFSHTLFAMPFALIGFFLAVHNGGADLSFRIFGLIILAMVFARNSAMGFNRWADRDIDAKNPRTASREIPAALLSPRSVALFVIVNVILFIVVAGLINNLTLILSIPSLAVLLGYSYLKRFTPLCHFGVGLALGIAPAAAYISVTGTIDISVLILSLVVFFWSGSFDILYALADEEFDKSEGLHSIPGAVGRKWALIISAAAHALVIPLLALFYFTAGMGILYIIGATLFSALLVYQHLIVKPNDISRLNAAFFTANGVASVVLAIFTIADLYF
ncbi:MAG: 4-hydroxybenzoate octaprenyltransferase [Bacteroidetes bacterium HGW-Bacteroidetes-10]|jgi:4-hydroxybenzoate polyprenyltransferase|nr:MAG: 4-hydroxybenzoate octaprenyltransferase [Bacteroidetes bacterium HGW-Bacteroidetes-10]